MRQRKRLDLTQLEAIAARRQRRARWLFAALAAVGLILALVNVFAGQSSLEVDTLAKSWWSLIPILIMAALAALVAARAFWLFPRFLRVRRWLTLTRPLHVPLYNARTAEQRIAGKLRDLPGGRPDHQAALNHGSQRLSRLVERPVIGDGVADMRRRVARIDAYRVALNTLEIDALIKKDFAASSASRLALEKALEHLDESQPESARVQLPSIAVLPFADLSPLGDQEHFSHGLAEDLIHGLSRIQGLRVIARGLSFSLAEQDMDLRAVGRHLGVAAILEGSVQRNADRLGVSARLLSVTSGGELWSGHFDESPKEIFEIESEIVNRVVEALKVRPSSDEQRAIDKSPTRIVEAYDLYLRGRRYFAQYHGRGMEFALEMFSRAIERDDRYALAWAGVADCSAFLYANSGRQPEHRERALEASARALELDPELPEAHVSRGVALSQGGRPGEAAPYFETALRLNPRLFEAHYFYARHHFTAGDAERAIEFYESAAEIRPEDYQVPLLSAQIYDDLGRPEEGRAVRLRGVEVAEEHVKLNPDDARALYIGANGLVALGQIEKGLRWAGLARELQPNEPMALYNLACVYSLAGEIDLAIDCFATCLDNGFSYRDWAEHDSNLDAIRDDPRFVGLMGRLA